MMLLSPGFLEEENYASAALLVPTSYDFSRLPPFESRTKASGYKQHERSKSAPLDDHRSGLSWDVSTPTRWDLEQCERRKRLQALEKDVFLLRMRLQEEQATRVSLEKALVNASSCLSPSSQSITSKTRELIAETALIEHEVAHLEQRVLLLYRKLLNEHAPTVHQTVSTPDQQGSRKIFRFVRKKQQRQQAHGLQSPDILLHSSMSYEVGSKSSLTSRRSSAANSPKASPLHHLLAAIQPKAQKKLSEMPVLEEEQASPGYELRSPSPRLFYFSNGNELSEALVRCMAGIYCKLALVDENPLSSSSPLFSPSSAGSSPMISGRILSNPYQLFKQLGDCGTYRFMVEVPWICVDSQQLAFAAQSLQEYKFMLKQLSNLDPASMERNEKVAFWINIYNALVMHAHLAYGIPGSRSKRESLLLKASYKVGNHSVNAYTIAQCMLGGRSESQGSSQWLQALLSPITKLKPREERHTYGLSTPEPLVCFALSSGARSDPSIRVYSAGNVNAQLKVAKAEFLQASVGLGKNNALVLPKVLEGYLNEIGISNQKLLLQWLCRNLPRQHAMSLKSSMKRSDWLPYNFSFRYIFARDSITSLDFG